MTHEVKTARSRLDSVIRRLSAQRDGLAWASAEIAAIKGDVLEIGLGNGRSYDHLRHLMPERRIWVIDRQLACHPACVPPKADFLQGDADAMLSELAQRKAPIALAHYDLGTGHDARDHEIAAALSKLIAPLMVSGGVILSDQPLIGFEQLPEPADIPEGRYMFYRSA